jgi:hypothetical protein
VELFPDSVLTDFKSSPALTFGATDPIGSTIFNNFQSSSIKIDKKTKPDSDNSNQKTISSEI